MVLLVAKEKSHFRAKIEVETETVAESDMSQERELKVTQITAINRRGLFSPALSGKTQFGDYTKMLLRDLTESDTPSPPGSIRLCYLWHKSDGRKTISAMNTETQPLVRGAPGVNLVDEKD
jgi:hypothetical protein